MDKRTENKQMIENAVRLLKRAGAVTLLFTLALCFPSINDLAVASATSMNTENDTIVEDDSHSAQDDVVESVKLNTSHLETLIEQGKSFRFADYTEVSFSKLTSSIETAESILINEATTQKNIDAAVITLQAAINALVVNEEANETEDIIIDKSTLKTVLGKAYQYDAAKYKEESFAFLTSAIDFAEYVLANENATQDEVDTARTTLENAIDSLIVKKGPAAVDTDRTLLVNLIEKAKGLNAKDYTADSFTDIKLAIGVAETLLAKESVTADEIGAAIGTLQNTIDRLVIVDAGGLVSEADVGVVVPQHSNTSTGNDTSTTGEVNGNDSGEVLGQRLPDTASSTFNILLAGVLAFIVGGLGLVFGKRRKRKCLLCNIKDK